MTGESLDIIQQKRKLLESAMPEVFSEGKVDCEKLRAALGDEMAQGNERYMLNWAGKSEAFKVLQATTTATLVPVKEESVDFDNTENIFIEGENLEVLKVLQRSYYGKIKMIYIDPPYNTGNDSFVYPDCFAESKDDYLKRIGDKDEEGYLLKEGMFRKNSKDNGHYHSNWLSMMYPRLFLARNLLKDDGVIFISIDDHEVHNLLLMMNEVYGEDNFIGLFSWVRKKKGSFLSDKIRKMTEYVVCYQKQANTLKYYGENAYIDKPQPIVKRTNSVKTLLFPKGLSTTLKDGKYEKGKRGKEGTSLDFLDTFEVKEGFILDSIRVTGRFVWKQKYLEDELLQGTKITLSNKFGFNALRYNQEDKIKTPSSLINNDYDVGTYEDATDEIADIFDCEIGTIFSYNKPVSLITYLVNMVTKEDNNAIILDFFAGSCTTAQAVIDLNNEDNGNRKFICVQLPEKCEEVTQAFRAGYKTIADIGKERIRRAIDNIGKEEDGKFDINKIIGFKVFKLKSSNFKIWQTQTGTAEELAKQIDAFIDPTRPDAKLDDMLYELLIKTGQDLNSRIEKLSCDGAEYYSVNNEVLVVALAKINEAVITEIISKKPQKVIALDKLFVGNDQLKTNTALQMKDAGVEFKTI